MRARLLAAVLAVAAASCSRDFVGTPKRPRTDGFRAHVTVKHGGKVLDEFELAVRGNARRRDANGITTVWDGDARKAFTVERGKARSIPFGSLDEVLPGHPLNAGFSEKEEAARRHIETYRRESDGVIAGHVCWIWSFDDRPDDPTSPYTTYWAAPDLDGLVMRVSRDTPGRPGDTQSSELTNVRVGADPELFRAPR